jgi:hypothetical protein
MAAKYPEVLVRPDGAGDDFRIVGQVTKAMRRVGIAEEGAPTIRTGSLQRCHPDARRNWQAGSRSSIQPRILLDRAKLVILHRYPSGLAHHRLKIGVKLELRRNPEDRIGGGAPRLQRAEIEHGLDLNETAQFVWLGRLAAGQRAPGKGRGPAGKHLLDGIGRHVHG